MPPVTATSTTLQASVVRLFARGCLIRGGAGLGKSSLALALLRAGGTIVADDLVSVRREGQVLVAAPVPGGAGLIELRSSGIFRLPHALRTRLDLCVDLARPQRNPPRLPAVWHAEFLGIRLPVIHLVRATREDDDPETTASRLIAALCSAERTA